MPLSLRRLSSPLPRRPGVLLAALAAALLAMAAPEEARAQHHGHHASSSESRVRHPEPRRGITAAGVLAPERVKEADREAYQTAHRIPRVLDGIHCHCDCKDHHPELHSLLDCFKSEMAANCGVCQAQANLGFDLHHAGKSLEEIRRAIDGRFGS